MKSYTIGRNYPVDIDVPDEYVSNLHARLTQDDDGQVWVEDLGSTNGTFINGHTVWKLTRIYPGDTLTVGRTDIPWKIQ